MNRTERLAAILVRLQARSLVRARDLAAEFEVGVRTIYRDMEALAESGVPLRAEAGVGYALERGWRLPPLALTEEEAAALLLACRIAGPGEDGRTAGAMGSALAKIRAVLDGRGRDYVERLDDNVASFASGLPRPEDSPKGGEVLATLRDALARGLVARIEYRSATGDATERLVEPCALYREPKGWRLLAWCRMRGDYRQFFASRIVAAQTTDETFDRSRHPRTEELLVRMGETTPTFEARIRCPERSARAFEEAAYAVRDRSVADGLADLTLVVGDADWYARATLSAAASIESVEPPALSEAYRRCASEILERIR